MSVLSHLSWLGAASADSVSGFGAVPWATCLRFSVTLVLDEVIKLSRRFFFFFFFSPDFQHLQLFLTILC